jgi:site-specific recombinase XerD
MVKERITLSRAIEGYFIAAHARRLSPATLADYDNTFRKLEEFLGRDPPLCTITPGDIRAFLGSMYGMSAKTLLNYHTGLSALWTWAVKEGIVDEHIMRDVDRPRPEKREIVPYTQRDLQAIMAACDRTGAYIRPGTRKSNHSRPTADRDRAIVLLLVDTGMRASELCDLRIRDLDIQNHRVRVMGKGRKERLLPISARTSQAIWRYLATRDGKRDNSFLFATRTEGPLERNNLRNTLKRIGKRAGVPGVTLHRFRHTFAIAFLRNNGHIMALQRLLGHSTMDMVTHYLAIAQADIETAHHEASPVTNWGL